MTSHVDKRRAIVHESDTQNWMERSLAQSAPYWRSIVAVIFGLIAVAIVMIFWNMQSTQKTQAQWEKFYRAREPQSFNINKIDNLKKEIKELGDSTPGQLLKLKTAQLLMSHGVSDLYRDREEGKKRIAEATTMFEELKKTSLPQVREAAMLGDAICLESTGKTAEAITAYDNLQKAFPDGYYTKMSEHRIKQLKDPYAKEFYSWFSTIALPSLDISTKTNPFATPGTNALGTLPSDMPSLGSPLNSPSGLDSPGGLGSSFLNESLNLNPKSDAPKGTDLPKATDVPKSDNPGTPPADPAAKEPAKSSEQTPAVPTTPDKSGSEKAAESGSGQKAETDKPADPAQEPAKK
jgi:hypothetical protein